MNKSIVVMIAVLAIIVAALLGLFVVLGGASREEAYDTALKVGLGLLVVLVACVAVGVLLPKNAKK